MKIRSRVVVESLLISSLIASGLSACTRGNTTASPSVIAGPPHIEVDQATHSALAKSPSAARSGNTAPPSAISVSVVINKSAILGRQFLYNVDLQYSGQYDKSSDLYSQSQVAGSIPVSFRIAGDTLELIADNTINFPSDVNHPEQLVSRFKILSQTDTQLTVSGADSAAYLAQQYGPDSNGSTEIAFTDHWIRSFEFDPNGDYILQQSSIEMGDGTVAEFMESVFPRDNTKAGPDFLAIKMDPDNPVGGTDGNVARYRYLHGQTVFTGEDKHTWSTHFDLSPKADGTLATIDWYVTPNIPDAMLTPVKEAVEAWNRYFLKENGVNRNVMRFMGRLPDGIHMGDPRYNVINWDSRLVAGAAYESSASDPETGKQSHSLIYMPAAWVAIGTSYWTTGIVSDSDPSDLSTAMSSLKSTHKMSAQIHCLRNLSYAGQVMASGRLSTDEIAQFGIQALKDTLFHEVGHALGLAHNFEGSLEFDRSKPGTLFSSSIMDYNDYEVERAAFNAVNTSEGPLLEYDRQAISSIYNQSKDISNTDRVVMACNDDEADNEDGGVNPICNRYDIEHDPTLSVITALNRVNTSKMDNDVTLEQAIGRIPEIFLTQDKIAAVKTPDDLVALASQLATTLKGSLRFYYMTGTESLRDVVELNTKSLLMYGDDLPDGYDAKSMRERAFTGVKGTIGILDIPASVKAALTQTQTQGIALLGQTPLMQSISDANRTALEKKLNDTITALLNGFITDQATGLPALRATILKSIARHTAVPFYVGSDDNQVTDYEKAVVGVLTDVVADKTRTQVERVAAAKSLATFKGRLSGNSAIASIKSKLLEERTTDNDNTSRETIETVLSSLGLNNDAS